MKTALPLGLVFTALLAPCQAAIVIDNFTNTGIIANTDNTGDIGSDSFTQTIVLSGTCVDISVDVTVATISGGDIHLETRGFGDGGGVQPAAEDVGEGFTLTFAPAVITNTSGQTLASITDNLTYQITGAQLINNGNNAPSISWSDTLGGSGSHSNAAGTVGGDSEAINGPFSVGAAHTVTITGTDNWWWLNDIGLEIGGNVTVDKIPEPSRALLIGAGLIVGLLRRRR